MQPTTEAKEPPLRVLHLEDSPLDAGLVGATLHRRGINAVLRRVETATQFESALKEASPDIILADFALPSFDGNAALAMARRICPDVPFLFVSGVMGEEVAIAALHQGATDYVLKQRLERLVPAVVRALEECRLRAERRAAESTLRERDAQLRLAMKSARLGEWSHDLIADRIIWGDSSYDLFGVPPGSFDGTPAAFLALVHPEDRARVKAEFADALARRADHEIEYRVLPPGGPERWVLGRGQVFCDDTGRPVKVVGVGMDVTERRQAEEALREADRRKDEFLAVLGHELRNPLVPITNAAALIRLEAAGSPRLQELADMVRRHATTLTRLVDELLDVGRIRRGQIELRTGRVELGELTRRAAEAARPVMQERGQTLRVEVPAGPVEFAGDPDRLGQVLSNLLTNAARYSEPGRSVTLSGSAPDGHIVLSVRDQGIGLRPESMSRIWEPFSQADRVPGRVSEGLGLGLSVVRRLVELHGGEVSAASDGPGTGSTFEVRLPRRPPPVSSSGSHAVSTATARTRRVLVCDDNTDGAETTAALLQSVGHEVCVTHTAADALATVADYRPDVCVLDVGLPDLDGRELARRLRATDAGRSAILIALTGFGADADRDSVLAAGFDRHFAKPIDPDSLLAVFG